MAEAVRALFRRQVLDCQSHGSPFTARLMALLAEGLDDSSPLGRRLLGWPPRVADNLPLRLAGGLHALARSGHPELAAVYPPHAVSDAVLAETVLRVIRDQGDRLLPWLDNPPQTNEVARSAVPIAAAHNWQAPAP